MKNGMHVDEYGHKRWYLNGQYHREDGPAVILANGGKYWYKNDLWHRLDGPACEWADGSKRWYKNNQLHREDGPAVITADGAKEWWLNGKRYYLFDEWLEEMNFSDDDKLILKLKWT